MKKNLVMRIAAVVLMCTLVTACFASSTFAKYTSQATGTDTARVAKWEFEVNNNNIATGNADETYELNLFDTIYDTNLASESDVANAATIIAPGTSGKFDVKLQNKSEVTAQYAIDFTVTNNANIPLEWSVDGGTTWTKSLDDITASDATKLAIGAAAKTLNIQWRWTYEVSDAQNASDTALGIAAVSADQTITVKAVITATQVD